MINKDNFEASNDMNITFFGKNRMIGEIIFLRVQLRYLLTYYSIFSFDNFPKVIFKWCSLNIRKINHKLEIICYGKGESHLQSIWGFSSK